MNLPPSTTRIARKLSILHRYLWLYLVKFLFRIRLLERYSTERVLFFGYPLRMDLPAHVDIYLYGCKMSASDLALQRYLLDNPTPHSVIFDVGASIGYYSLFFHRLTAGASNIYAIEPGATALPLLRANTASHPSIHILDLALGREDTTSRLYEFRAAYEEYNTIVPDEFILTSGWMRANTLRERSVRVRSVDSLVDQIGVVPDLVKIDTEGGEALIIDGMTATLQVCKPDFLLRFWPGGRHNTSQLMAIGQLTEIGYVLHSLPDLGRMSIQDLVHYRLEYLLLKFA